MALNQILKLTSATFATNPIDGVVEASIQHIVGEKSGRLDGSLGPVSVDAVNERLEGTLIVADDDADIDLMTGAVGVLVLNYKEDGGAAKSLTIGLLADTTGVIFTQADQSVDQGAEGQVPLTTLQFRTKYQAGAGRTFGSTLGGSGSVNGVAEFG